MLNQTATFFLLAAVSLTSFAPLSLALSVEEAEANLKKAEEVKQEDVVSYVKSGNGVITIKTDAYHERVKQAQKALEQAKKQDRR